jgi:hypothetical protein
MPSRSNVITMLPAYVRQEVERRPRLSADSRGSLRISTDRNTIYFRFRFTCRLGGRRKEPSKLHCGPKHQAFFTESHQRQRASTPQRPAQPHANRCSLAAHGRSSSCR